MIFEHHRDKAKSRPAHSSAYSIVPDTHPEEAESTQPKSVYRVKHATFEVFSTLFSKSDSHGSIPWIAFEKAMADLNFSVVPKFGAAFTFIPPNNFVPARSLSFHRPHHSRIEGYKLAYFANRLKRVYGWGGGTFEVV
ncbi:hypothetical protein BJX70DRAFT_398681 [Aspergillus crustosus]